MNKMAPARPGLDPEFQKLAAQAMGIYWRDVIDVPIIQWLHRIPYNNTYWTNWPSEKNLADGENGAFWAHTGMLESSPASSRAAQSRPSLRSQWRVPSSARITPSPDSFLARRGMASSLETPSS